MLAAAAGAVTQLGPVGPVVAEPVARLPHLVQPELLIPAAAAVAVGLAAILAAARAVRELLSCVTQNFILMQPAPQGHLPTLLPAAIRFTNGPDLAQSLSEVPMAHFAEIDDANTVLRVIVLANVDCCDASGIEREELGAAFCNALLGGRWVQTSYNANFRQNYAGIGYKYDEILDVFVAPSSLTSG